MDMLHREDLKTLIEQNGGPCVSMFLPMQRAGKETRQNPIRMKNMLREAEEQLRAQGMNDTAVQGMLAPAQTLLDDSEYWLHQSDGLALFCSPENFSSYRLPVDFDERLRISDHFYIKPLLPLVSANEPFYLLALSKHSVRLFQGNLYALDELDLPPEVPTHIEQVTGYDEPEEQLQFRTNVPAGRGGEQAAIFHGQGEDKDRQQTYLLRYFTEIDRGLQQLLRDEQAPMVLAGVDYLLPLYRERNSYPHLLEKGIVGNPEPLKTGELHAQAWQIVVPHLKQAQQKVLDRYQQLIATEQTTSDLRTIIPAARYGRIDTLFIAPDMEEWGTFDPTNDTLEIHAEATTGDQDLLDFAAVHTLMHSGTVYAVERDMIPKDGPVAALLRY